ncbi:MAG: PQQ-binding-like beta-propeller repeat protein [Planctomycetota bacterium]
MRFKPVNDSTPSCFTTSSLQSPLSRSNNRRPFSFAPVARIASITLMLLFGWCWLAQYLPGWSGRLVCAAEPEPIRVAPTDWPWWRGPHGNGVAASDQQAPTTWNATKNIVWKANVPGRGHSSPTVMGDQVIVTTAEEDKEIQAVISYDRATGKQRWRTDVHRGGFDKKGNKKTSQASGSAAFDGSRIIVNFLNQGAIYTTALDPAGKQIWQTRVSDFATHQGFGSSPTLFGPYAYIATDSRASGVVAALDRATGKIAWSQSRPDKPSYASVSILNVAGKQQAIIQGCDLVTSYDPLTGNKFWEIEGSTTECVTSVVTDGELIFVSGGYPRNHTQAVKADGSGKTVWENGTRVYVPSMLVSKGFLYASLDAGVAMCWKSSTGEEMWKSRLGGTFSASLVQVGDLLYATNESGTIFLFKANPQEFQLVGQNQLGDEVYATPSICGGRIYHRVAEIKGDQRQEVLYCIGEAK